MYKVCMYAFGRNNSIEYAARDMSNSLCDYFIELNVPAEQNLGYFL